MGLRYHGHLPMRDAKTLGDDLIAFYSHYDLKSHAFSCMKACVGDCAEPVLPQDLFSRGRDSFVW